MIPNYNYINKNSPCYVLTSCIKRMVNVNEIRIIESFDEFKNIIIQLISNLDDERELIHKYTKEKVRDFLDIYLTMKLDPHLNNLSPFIKFESFNILDFNNFTFYYFNELSDAISFFKNNNEFLILLQKLNSSNVKNNSSGELHCFLGC